MPGASSVRVGVTATGAWPAEASGSRNNQRERERVRSSHTPSTTETIPAIALSECGTEAVRKRKAGAL